MKVIEFDYYDWNEFEEYLDSLSDKDATKLLAVINNIEEYGLAIAERQKWTKKLVKFVLSTLLIFNGQFIFTGKIIDTSLRMALLKRHKKRPSVKLRRECSDVRFLKGGITMSKIDEYIARRSQQSTTFAREYEEENQRLQVSVEVRNLREQFDMTQREFANLVGKPQSTIARIESGKMNVSIDVLNEIATATKQKLTVKFEPVNV